MSSRRLSLPLAVALVGASAPTALAHIQLRTPLQRTTELKNGPCGAPNDTRGQNVCQFRPGSTITVQFDETVEHPGHFRVSFDDDGQDGFVDPTGFDDTSGGPTVLLDGIADRDTRADGNSLYSIQVTLPDVECDNCTLQVIQVMSDKPPYGDGNDIYYQCADLVLSQSAPAEPAPGCAPAAGGGDDAGPGGGGGGADAGPGGGGGGGSGDAGNTSGGATGDPSDAGGGCATAGSARTGAPAALFIGLAALFAIRPRRRRAGAGASSLRRPRSR
ncbi:MAG TPA: SCE4755 family polysaccharide monooxygenase-like protein [Kofleriaceae bacterium]|nr:SCE4755 family polysaccharide monooxygenase-like protein [Kofleriaceae bacterium]